MGQSVPSRGVGREQKLFQIYQITKKGLLKIVQKQQQRTKQEQKAI